MYHYYLLGYNIVDEKAWGGDRPESSDTVFPFSISFSDMPPCSTPTPPQGGGSSYTGGNHTAGTCGLVRLVSRLCRWTCKRTCKWTCKQTL